MEKFLLRLVIFTFITFIHHLLRMLNCNKLIFRECLNEISHDLILNKSSFYEINISATKKTKSSLKNYVIPVFQ